MSPRSWPIWSRTFGRGKESKGGREGGDGDREGRVNMNAYQFQNKKKMEVLEG